MNTPMLVLYGAMDEAVPEEPILETIARFGRPATYEVVETGWHLLLRWFSNVKVKSYIKIIYLRVVFRFKHLDGKRPQAGTKCLKQPLAENVSGG